MTCCKKEEKKVPVELQLPKSRTFSQPSPEIKMKFVEVNFNWNWFKSCSCFEFSSFLAVLLVTLATSACANGVQSPSSQAACFTQSTELCELTSRKTSVLFLKSFIVNMLIAHPQPFAFDIWQTERGGDDRRNHFQILTQFAEMVRACISRYKPDASMIEKPSLYCQTKANSWSTKIFFF